MQGKGFGGFRRLREEEKQRERKEKDKHSFNLENKGKSEGGIFDIFYSKTTAEIYIYATSILKNIKKRRKCVMREKKV